MSHARYARVCKPSNKEEKKVNQANDPNSNANDDDSSASVSNYSD